jgi:hypothetical protein
MTITETLQPQISLAAINRVFAASQPPAVMIIGNVQHAIIQAHLAFRGRDRRRIKREVNKAIRRAARP